jgi:hypothetical protein
MLLGLKPACVCDVISVVAGFVVDVAAVEVSMHLTIRMHSRAAAPLTGGSVLSTMHPRAAAPLTVGSVLSTRHPRAAAPLTVGSVLSTMHPRAAALLL